VSVVVGLLAGALAVVFLRVGAPDVLAAPALERENYRGHRLPTAAGILVVLAVLMVEAGRAILGALEIGEAPGLSVDRSLVLFAAFAFGLLGFVDDALGDDSARGFRGHIGALVGGRITTGALKLFGGAGVAVVLVATPGFATGRRLLVDAVLIALAANLGNLLDRAPGRTLKCALVAYVPLAFVLGTGPAGIAIAPAMGAAFALLPDDLGERVMLGDTGANVIGAVLGLGVVLGRGETTRVTALVVVVVLTILAEAVSISKIIDRTRPLRVLDRLGATQARRRS
jgi:UDP-GlcNAc:undecaprenyl-phosphate GlcNAc-1-phosphate transferase